MTKKLKCFIVSFKLVDKVDYHNVMISAYDQKEALKIFITHMDNKHIEVDESAIIIQNTRKTKLNSRFFTLDYYNDEIALVFEYNSDLQALKNAKEGK